MRLDELLQREPAGPARDTLSRLAGQPTAGVAPAAPSRPASAAAPAADPGLAARVHAEEAAAEEDSSFGALEIAQILLMATGIGIPIAGAIQYFKDRGASREAAAAERGARSQGLAAIQRRMLAGDSVHNAVTNAFKAGEVEGIVGTPDGFEDLAALKELLTMPDVKPGALQKFRQGNEEVAQRYNPATGTFEEVGRGAAFAPSAPSVVVNQPPAEKELSIQKARADAQRIYTDIPAMRRELRGQQQNSGAMIQLLESGTETGQWPDAVKRTIRDRFGVDVGLDPGLETLATMAGQQMLTEAQQLKGSFSDRDVQLIQSLTASPGRGREANIAVLSARQEVLKRLDREAELEEQYFERNQSRAGFEQWLQTQDLGPMFSQDAITAITKPIQAAEQRLGKVFESLSGALQARDRAAVGKFVTEMGTEGFERLPPAVQDEVARLLGVELQ